MDGNIIVRGDFIEGSSLIVKKENGKLIRGLEFADGRTTFLDFDYIAEFHCGLAEIDKKGKSGFINRSGEIVIEPKYQIGGIFTEDRAFVIDNGYTILIDVKGNEIRKFEENFISHLFNDGLARMMRFIDFDNSVTECFVDREGRFVLDNLADRFLEDPYFYCDEDFFYSDGLIRVQSKDKFGFINKEGEVIIPFIYEEASRFENGIAMVNYDNHAGFINKNNEVVFPFKYEEAYNFVNGLAPVKNNGKWGLIDFKDNLIIDFEYDDMKKVKNNQLVTVMNGKYGMFSIDTGKTIPMVYDDIWPICDGIIKVTLNGKPGVLDLHGNFLLDDRDLMETVVSQIK